MRHFVGSQAVLEGFEGQGVDIDDPALPLELAAQFQIIDRLVLIGNENSGDVIELVADMTEKNPLVKMVNPSSLYLFNLSGTAGPAISLTVDLECDIGDGQGRVWRNGGDSSSFALNTAFPDASLRQHSIDFGTLGQHLFEVTPEDVHYRFRILSPPAPGSYPFVLETVFHFGAILSKL